MAEVPREIMNHLRAKMYNDRHTDTVAIPGQRRSIEEVVTSPEQVTPEPENPIKRAISRLALSSTEPGLTGD